MLDVSCFMRKGAHIEVILVRKMTRMYVRRVDVEKYAQRKGAQVVRKSREELCHQHLSVVHHRHQEIWLWTTNMTLGLDQHECGC